MEAIEDKNPIVIDEVVNLEFDGSENKAERAEFAFVVFHNLAETYPEDADLRFQYTLTPDLVPTTRDWVGLYKVGWMSPKDYLYYEWAPIPGNYKVGSTADASVVFPESKLPKEDGEFYQLCYVSSSSQIRGASTPFQFRRPGNDEYVEVEDEETNMLVIRSKTAFLEENLQRAESQKIRLSENLDLLQREKDEVVTKHQELMKKLAAKDARNTELSGKLAAAETQLAQLKREARDMTLVRDELQGKIEKLKLEQANLENTIGEFKSKLTKMAARLKELETERDELSGKNTNLEDQVAMYKEHFATSETAVKSYSSQTEELQVRLAQQESLVHGLTDTVDDMTKALAEQRQLNSETQADCEGKLAEIEEKLKNAEDKLSAAEESKGILQAEISSYEVTQQELSRQIERSRGECDSVKQKLCVLEEDFTQKNRILETEMDQMRSDLVIAIQEKEKVQGENGNLAQQLSTKPEAMTVMKQSLNQIKARLEKKEKHCKNMEKSLMAREHEFLQGERDMQREIEDLKEKIVMCSEEYKAIYIEKNKLQRKLDKVLKKKGKPDRMAESMIEIESKQTTSTPVGCGTPEEEEGVNLEPLRQEIDRQVEDLEREMEQGLTKKLKYKNLYRQELERSRAATETHASDMKEKNTEIRRLKQRLMEIPSEYDLKVRALEKCVAEKLQEIDLLNQKLRQFNQSRNDEAGASTVPSKYGAIPNESKYRCPVYGPGYPHHEPPMTYTPYIVYPHQTQLQYPHMQAEPQITSPTAVPLTYPMQMPLPPLQYPAHTSRGQLSDTSPVQRCQTDEIMGEGPRSGDILDSREQEAEALEQPLTPLPPPLEPEVLPSSKMAAVKKSKKDEVDVIDEFIAETNLKVVLPNEPVNTPSAPPQGLMEKEDRFYDAEGVSMKHCTYCQQTFSVDVDEQTFEEHVLAHIVGQICPICKMTRHENMTDNHFENHVNGHMDNNNEDVV